MSDKILITGSEGFIGSKLKEEIEGQVYTLDINGSGEKHINEDVSEYEEFQRFDKIFHLAAISNPGTCEENKEKAWEVNVEGTRNILTQLEEDQELVFSSSAHVYGEAQNKTEDSKLEPDNFYGLTKKISENLIENYARHIGFDYRIMRFFNIYGPGQSEGFLVPDVVRKAIEMDQVEVIGPETEISPVHIDDAIDVLTRDIPEGVYNISNECVRISEIYQILCAEFDTPVEIGEKGEGGRMCGDSSKIKSYKQNWISPENGLKGVAKELSKELQS